jgi:hypothetical protein
VTGGGGGWRKLNSGALNNLPPSPDINRLITAWKMRCVGHLARMGDKCIHDFDRKVIIPLEKPSYKWEDNIKMDLKHML